MIVNEITDCGEYDRTIYRINSLARIGCFVGTFEEAADAIKAKYGRGEYFEKLKQLFAGGTEVPDTVNGLIEDDLYEFIYRGEFHEILSKHRLSRIRKAVARVTKDPKIIETLKNDPDLRVRRVANGE